MAFWFCNEFCEFIDEEFNEPFLTKDWSHLNQIMNWSFSNAEYNVWEKIDCHFLEFLFK